MTVVSWCPDTVFFLHKLQAPVLALINSPLSMWGTGKDWCQHVSSLRSAMVPNSICISATHGFQLPSRTPAITQTHSTFSRTGVISTVSLLSLSCQLFPKIQTRCGIRGKSYFGDHCSWACGVPAPRWHGECCQPQPYPSWLCTQHFRNRAWLVEQTPILSYYHNASQ